MNEIKKLTALAKTKYLSLYDVMYTNKAKETKNWIVATRKSEESVKGRYFKGTKDVADAVVIVAYHEQYEKIILVKQHRIPINDYVYELPAGLIDEGEDISTTLKRELKEETGLELSEVCEALGHNKLYLSPGMTDESVALIYCKCKGEISTQYLEEDEDIEPLMFSQEEAKQLLKQEEILIDIKLAIVLQNFVRLGSDLFK